MSVLFFDFVLLGVYQYGKLAKLEKRYDRVSSDDFSWRDLYGVVLSEQFPIGYSEIGTEGNGVLEKG